VSVVANVAINVDSRGATQKLREVQSQAQQTERAFGGVAAAAGKLAAAFSVIQAAKFVFAKTAELESQTRSLQVLTGSAEKAGQIIKELQQLGAVTPFTSTELIDSAKRLQAFGVEADKVVETTRRLADVSGATGAELQGLVTAYGQVQAKGRLQGEELLQFQERGVALQQELRKMYALSGDEFQKALSKGRISAEAVEVAIKRLTDVGGKYANGAIAQSDTLAGKFSTLQDGIESLARDIGTKLAPALKNVLNLAIGAVNAIGNVLAGGFAKQAMDLRTALILPGNTVDDLQKILALTQGISTRGLGKSAIEQIGAEIKTNQTAVSNVLANINAQRPFGVTQQEQNLAEAIQGTSQKKIQELQRALDALQRQQKQPQQPTTIPDLLPETTKEKKDRQLSIDDLLGGDIQRQLREQQSKLSVARQTMLNVAAGQPNAQQAQRMVESSAALLDIKYQIDAIDKTIAARDAVRGKIVASSTDKAQTALAFDEQTADLKAAKLNLERDIDKVMLDQLGKAQEQYRNEQKAIENVLLGLESERIKLNAKTDAEKQAIQFLEIENQLKAQGIALSDADKEAIRGKIAEIQKLTKEQQAANAKLQMEKDLFEGISNTVAGAFSGAIDAAVKGTENLGDALKGLAVDLLATIGKMMIMYGIAQALGAAGGSDGVGVFSFLAKGFGFRGAKDGAYWPGGFEAFAQGGVVTSPTMGLIGEGGEPEYVIPQSKMSAAMSRYSRGARGESVIPGSGTSTQASGTATATMEPIDVRYSVERINNVDYVTADQFQAGMAQAAQQGAIQGERRAMRTLTNSAAARGRLRI
jgi:tape measure domain-containing protein